jgi:hypothetical protein
MEKCKRGTESEAEGIVVPAGQQADFPRIFLIQTDKVLNRLNTFHIVKIKIITASDSNWRLRIKESTIRKGYFKRARTRLPEKVVNKFHNIIALFPADLILQSPEPPLDSRLENSTGGINNLITSFKWR